MLVFRVGGLHQWVVLLGCIMGWLCLTLHLGAPNPPNLGVGLSVVVLFVVELVVVVYGGCVGGLYW